MLLVADEESAQTLREAMPIVPAIEGDYGGEPFALGEPAVEVKEQPPRRVAWGQAPWSEGQQDYLLAQAKALGIDGKVRFADRLPGDWASGEEA